MQSIELVRELNDFAHTLLEMDIDRRVPEQFFRAQAGSGVVSAAGIYTHAVLNEDHFVSNHLGEPLTYVSGGWESRLLFEPRADITAGWAEALRFDVDLIREYARAVYARSGAFLAALTAEASAGGCFELAGHPGGWATAVRAAESAGDLRLHG